MQPEAQSAERSGGEACDPPDALAEHPRQRRADERGAREDGSRSGRADGPLRAQVEPQARAVAARAAGRQRQGGGPLGEILVKRARERRRRHGAQRRLDQHDLRRIPVRERTPDSVVCGPGERRDHDGDNAPAGVEPRLIPPADEQSAGRRHCHERGADPCTYRLGPQDTR